MSQSSRPARGHLASRMTSAFRSCSRVPFPMGKYLNRSCRDDNRDIMGFGRRKDDSSVHGAASIIGGDISIDLEDTMTLPVDEQPHSPDDASSWNSDGAKITTNAASAAVTNQTNRQVETYTESSVLENSGNKETENDKEEAGRCAWFVKAPLLLKIVLICCLILIIAAATLVAVGYLLSMNEDDSPRNSVISNNTPQPTSTPAPTISLAPTQAPSSVPSASPTELVEESIIQFYITAGRYTGNALAEAEDQLRKLPLWGERAFMVHLGDWNSPSITQCDESSYQDIVDLFRKSAVPVYWTVGDNEFNDCPVPEEALEHWKNYLINFETTFYSPPSWIIWRQGDGGYRENWVFADSGVVFSAVNLVGGLIHDNDEWDARLQANLDWIDEHYFFYRGENQVMFLFAHAAPGENSLLDTRFYDVLVNRIRRTYREMKFIIAYRGNFLETAGIIEQYQDVSNLSLLTVEASTWPVMRVRIDTEKGFALSFEQNGWM